MKSFNLVLSLLLIAPSSIILAEDKGETHTTSTDSSGTTVTTDKSHSESVGLLGTHKVTEDEETVVDPKGMLNEKTAKSHSEVKTLPNGDYVASNVKKHADGTKEEFTAEKSTASHWTNKGKTTTTSVAKSVDPQGLGNKQDVEVIKKTETNPDGTSHTTITKKVNGETVSEVTKPGTK